MIKSKRRKGFVLISMSALLLISSVAFFTDRKLNATRGKLGTLAVATVLDLKSDLRNVAPGDEVLIDLSIQNQGSLDGMVRTSYSLVVPDEDLQSYAKGDMSLKVDSELVVDIVNTPHSYTDNLLKSLDIQEHEVTVNISPTLLNKIQGLNFKVEVLTEIKQLDSKDWVELATESIAFGSYSDYDVVPGNNVLRSDRLGINRTSAFDLQTQGYAVTNLNEGLTYSLDEYKDLFLNPNENLKVFSADGLEIEDSAEIVETGSLVKLVEEGNTLDELTFITKGDLNNDGEITSQDVLSLRAMLSWKQNIITTPVKPYSDLDFIAADMDDDGEVTLNDAYIVAALEYGSIEYPDMYPVAPNLKYNPRLGLSFIDNDTRDRDSLNIPKGPAIRRGGYVEPGQSFKLAINTRDLAGLNISGIAAVLELGSEYLEFDNMVIDYKGELIDIGKLIVAKTSSEDENSALPIPYSMVHLDMTVNYEDDLSDLPRNLPFNIRTSGNSNWYHPNDDNIHFQPNKDLVYVGLKVREDAPSGTRLDVNLKGGGVHFKGYGGLFFYQNVDFNVNNFVRVK